jgi:hypothetical protein
MNQTRFLPVAILTGCKPRRACLFKNKMMREPVFAGPGARPCSDAKSESAARVPEQSGSQMNDCAMATAIDRIRLTAFLAKNNNTQLSRQAGYCFYQSIVGILIYNTFLHDFFMSPVRSRDRK